MDKIKVVKGIAQLADQDWKYFCRKKTLCLFVNDQDDVIEIERKNIDFVEEPGEKSRFFNLIKNRNRRYEKEKMDNYFAQFDLPEHGDQYTEQPEKEEEEE